MGTLEVRGGRGQRYGESATTVMTRSFTTVKIGRRRKASTTTVVTRSFTTVTNGSGRKESATAVTRSFATVRSVVGGRIRTESSDAAIGRTNRLERISWNSCSEI